MPASQPSDRPSLLVLDDVSRRFGGRVAVDRVTLAIEPGEIHLIVGPNGSGKSTLARLAVGLLRPHGGRVRIRGEDPRGDDRIRGTIGYLGHESQLYDDLEAAENLRFAARLRGAPLESVEPLLARFGVVGERRTAVRRLSRGFVQRVALAKSLIGGPELVVWDEPLTGLDQPSVAAVMGVIEAERSRGAGILLISHDLPELWRLRATVHLVAAGAIRLTADTSLGLEAFRGRVAEVAA